MDDLVKQAREALDGVMPGPWRVHGWSRPMQITGDVHIVTDPENFPSAFVPAWDAPEPGQVDGSEEAKANARFIAASRTLVPAMADRIEAQAKRIAELEAALQFYAGGENIHGVIWEPGSDQGAVARAALKGDTND